MTSPGSPRNARLGQAFALLLAACSACAAHAQWQILPAPTSADLRGIHAVSDQIAWASGTNGTVLRTTDAGAHWALCPTPPAAEHLDFRGIQAFDARIAIVMSSGKGDLSRLYKTTDACAPLNQSRPRRLLGRNPVLKNGLYEPRPLFRYIARRPCG